MSFKIEIMQEDFSNNTIFPGHHKFLLKTDQNDMCYFSTFKLCFRKYDDQFLHMYIRVKGTVRYLSIDISAHGLLLIR